MSKAIGALYDTFKSEGVCADESPDRWLRALVTTVSPPPNNSAASNSDIPPSPRPKDHRRLIYLRNYRRITSVALPLLNALVHAVQTSRGLTTSSKED